MDLSPDLMIFFAFCATSSRNQSPRYPSSAENESSASSDPAANLDHDNAVGMAHLVSPDFNPGEWLT